MPKNGRPSEEKPENFCVHPLRFCCRELEKGKSKKGELLEHITKREPKGRGGECQWRPGRTGQVGSEEKGPEYNFPGAAEKRKECSTSTKRGGGGEICNKRERGPSQTRLPESEKQCLYFRSSPKRAFGRRKGRIGSSAATLSKNLFDSSAPSLRFSQNLEKARSLYGGIVYLTVWGRTPSPRELMNGGKTDAAIAFGDQVKPICLEEERGVYSCLFRRRYKGSEKHLTAFGKTGWNSKRRSTRRRSVSR